MGSAKERLDLAIKPIALSENVIGSQQKEKRNGKNGNRSAEKESGNSVKVFIFLYRLYTYRKK